MNGAVSTTARPIRQASSAASRAVTTGNAARSCSAARPISNLSGADDTISPFEFSNPWFGTLRARGGVALNNVLLYGTGGLAYGDLRADSFNLTESHTTVGWTAGAGVEVAL